MQSKNQISLFPLSNRYEKYCFVKSDFRNESTREIFFERRDGKEIENIQSKADRQQKGFQGNSEKSKRDKSSIESGGRDERRSCIRQLNNPKHSNNRVYSEHGISPTLNTAQGGNRQPFILRQRPNYIDGKRELKNYEYNKTSPTLSTNCGSGDQKNMVVQSFQDRYGIDNGRRVRRLTPCEAERLMNIPDGWLKYGIDDKENQVEISDSQKYKLAGNGVVVSVVEEIIKKLI